MAKKDEEKKYWMWAQVEEGAHTAALELSTVIGKHPSKILEMGLELIIAHYASELEAKGKPVPPALKLEALAARDRKEQLQINQVKTMAYNHLQTPTDESADRLAEACDLAGISIEAIMEQVSANPHVADFVTNGKSLTSVEAFLVDYIKPGKMYQAKDVMAAGEERGFKVYLIKEAKRKLGIVSRNEKGGWVWFFPETEVQKTEGEEEVF